MFTKLKELIVHKTDDTQDRMHPTVQHAEHRVDEAMQVGNERIDQMKHKLDDNWNRTKQGAANTLQQSSEKLGDIKIGTYEKMDSAKETLVDKAKDISAGTSNAWDTVKQATADATNATTGKIHDITQSVSDTVSDMTHSASNKMHDIGKSISDTTHGLTSAAADKLNVFKVETDQIERDSNDKLRDMKQGSLAKYETLKDKNAKRMDEMKEETKHGWSLFKSGAEDTKNQAANKLSSVSKKAGQKVDETQHSLKDTLHKVEDATANRWNSLKTGAEETYDDAKEKAADLANSVAWSASNHKNIAIIKAGEAVDTLKHGAEMAKEGAQSVAQGVQNYGQFVKDKAMDRFDDNDLRKRNEILRMQEMLLHEYSNFE